MKPKTLYALNVRTTDAEVASSFHNTRKEAERRKARVIEALYAYRDAFLKLNDTGKEKDRNAYLRAKNNFYNLVTAENAAFNARYYTEAFFTPMVNHLLFAADNRAKETRRINAFYYTNKYATDCLRVVKASAPLFDNTRKDEEAEELDDFNIKEFNERRENAARCGLSSITELRDILNRNTPDIEAALTETRNIVHAIHRLSEISQRQSSTISHIAHLIGSRREEFSVDAVRDKDGRWIAHYHFPGVAGWIQSARKTKLDCALDGLAKLTKEVRRYNHLD